MQARVRAAQITSAVALPADCFWRAALPAALRLGSRHWTQVSCSWTLDFTFTGCPGFLIPLVPQPYSATDHTKYGKGASKCPADGYCINCMPLKVLTQRLTLAVGWLAALSRALLRPAGHPSLLFCVPQPCNPLLSASPFPLPHPAAGQGRVLAGAQPHPLLPLLLRQAGRPLGAGHDERVRGLLGVLVMRVCVVVVVVCGKGAGLGGGQALWRARRPAAAIPAAATCCALILVGALARRGSMCSARRVVAVTSSTGVLLPPSAAPRIFHRGPITCSMATVEVFDYGGWLVDGCVWWCGVWGLGGRATGWWSMW
jgi:hypothetical protein